MLSIRLQRTGRKSLAMFRVVVQDSRRTPTSGNIVAQLGTYNPHTKELVLDEEKAKNYLKNGAQPSPRVISLLKSKKIKIPTWVKENKPSDSKTRHPEKLRRNNPITPESASPAEPTVTDEVVSVEAPVDEIKTTETVESVEPAANEAEKPTEK